MKLSHSLALAFMLSTSLTLAACATSGDCSSDPICIAEQGVTALYQTHTFLDNEAVQLHASGVLVGSTFDTVKADLKTAKTYLDAAYAATTVADINADLSKAGAAIAAAEKDGNLKAPGA